MFIKKKVMLIITFLMLWSCSFSYINLSPSSFDKNIKKGGYEEYTLYNDTSIPFRYKITPMQMDGTKKVADMSNWIEVYPKIVTVNPQSSEKFKVYIKAPKGSADGDYGAFLNIRQMSAPKIKGEKSENIGAGMIVMVNVNLGIYGYVGDEKVKVHCTEPVIYKKDGKSYLKMKIENDSNRLVKMEVQVEGKRGYFFPIGKLRAFKEQTLVVDNEIPKIGEMKVKKILIKDTETDEIISEIKVK